jgi:hypothetical protein
MQSGSCSAPILSVPPCGTLGEAVVAEAFVLLPELEHATAANATTASTAANTRVDADLAFTQFSHCPTVKAERGLKRRRFSATLHDWLPTH